MDFFLVEVLSRWTILPWTFFSPVGVFFHGRFFPWTLAYFLNSVVWCANWKGWFLWIFGCSDW